MAVQRIVAGVELAAGEPAVERRLAVVEHLVPAPGPVDRLGLLGPEALGVAERTLMKCAVCVADGHVIPSLSHRLRALSVRLEPAGRIMPLGLLTKQRVSD